MEELDLKAKPEVRRPERESLLYDLMNLVQLGKIKEDIFIEQINFFATDEEYKRIIHWWEKIKIVRGYIERFRCKQISRGIFLTSIRVHVTPTEFDNFVSWTSKFLPSLKVAS